MTTTAAAELPTTKIKIRVTYRTRTKASGEVTDVRWRHDGRAWSRSFTDPAMAARWGELFARVGHEAGLSALGDAPSELADTLESTARSYIASRTRLGEATRHRYGRYLERDFADLSPLPITLITRQDVIDWVQVQQIAGSASKTIKNKLRFLSSVFTYACDHDLAKSNPAVRIDIGETLDEEMTFLSVAEFQILHSFIPENYQSLIYVLAFTGLRWSEATSLVGSDVDLNRGKLSINKARKWTPTGYVIGPPKTRRSKRVIPIGEDLVSLLSPLVIAAGADGLLFKNQADDPVRSPAFWQNTWQRARRLANGEPAIEYLRGPDKDSARARTSIQLHDQNRLAAHPRRTNAEADWDNVAKPTRPTVPHRYPSFISISLGQPVHLRLAGECHDVAPTSPTLCSMASRPSERGTERAVRVRVRRSRRSVSGRRLRVVLGSESTVMPARIEVKRSLAGQAI